MLAIIGTVPYEDRPLAAGRAEFNGRGLNLGGGNIDIDRGTPALLAAACAASNVLGLKPPYAFLAGDIGLGSGSAIIYEHLIKNLPGSEFSVLVFHYLQPDVDAHNKVLFAIQEMASRPVLIADAGFMYAAKMSGQAREYDLFTPDAGELAFLADEQAPHPFYTRGFILQENNRIPDLISRAYVHSNAAANLLVKGETDYVADKDGIKDSVSSPRVEALEAMGGTGDTLAGLAAALIESGLPIDRACMLAARANREAGEMARPGPGSQVGRIIDMIPRALEKILAQHSNPRPN